MIRQSRLEIFVMAGPTQKGRGRFYDFGERYSVSMTHVVGGSCQVGRETGRQEKARENLLLGPSGSFLTSSSSQSSESQTTTHCCIVFCAPALYWDIGPQRPGPDEEGNERVVSSQKASRVSNIT
jgi:hypothetical protein